MLDDFLDRPRSKSNRTKKKLIKQPSKVLEKAKKREEVKAILQEKKALISQLPTVEPMVPVELPKPKKEESLENATILWQPNPGVQTEFLQANEDEVLFAGGRGSGKSMALVVDPLRYIDNKNFRGLIIRRTMPELRELISRARDIYLQAIPGSKWKEQEKMFLFPSGARIEFGYCDSLDDLERYRGQEYTWLGIDEITQFPSAETLEKLKASLRSTDSTLPIQIRATCNPTGAGRGWVKERWVDKAPSGVAFKNTYKTRLGDLSITRKWFHSTIHDNPTLLNNNPQYVASLASLKGALGKQWLDGDWVAFEGLAFPEFDKLVHTVKPYKLPPNLYRFRACDWGYASMAVCLWFALDNQDNLIVYREFKTKGMLADEFARKILELEEGEYIRYGVLDGSAWSARGELGESPADTMIRLGTRFTQSDRSPGSRKHGKLRLHHYLKVDEETGLPKIKFFDTCVETIKELESLCLDVNNPEDIDSSKKSSLPDHAYDALRYGLLSRPEGKLPANTPFTSNYNSQPVIVDTTFGY